MDSRYCAAGWRRRREGGFCLWHLSREQRLPGRFRPARQGRAQVAQAVARQSPHSWAHTRSCVSHLRAFCAGDMVQQGHRAGVPSGHSQTTPEVSECFQQPPSQPLTQMLITPGYSTYGTGFVSFHF